MVEPAVSFGSAGLLPNQASRVNNGSVNNRARYQRKQGNDHQRNTLREAFILLLDAAIIDQHVADFSGTR